MNKSRLFSILPSFFLILFAFIFSYDLIFLKRYLNHPEYVAYYPAFRHWFVQNLRSGHFPIWNPYWGLGHSTEIEASFPIDLYTVFEWSFGPQYHWFYLIQASFILLAGFFCLRKLHFSRSISLLGILGFFLSPWVNYFFLYWIKANSFIGLFLTFACAHVWFQTQNKIWLPLIAFATAFSLSGTKLDFWFFHCAFFGIYTIAVAFYLKPKLHELLSYCLALLAGILMQAWQIIPLYQILQASDRLGSTHGWQTLVSTEVYYKLILSLASSPLWKMSLCIALALLALRSSKKNAVLFSLLSGISFLALFQWRNPLWPALMSPYGLGALLGLTIYFYQVRPNRREFVSTLLAFLPLAFYWLRPEPGDIHELTILHKAPWAMKILSPFLCLLGCGQLRKSSLAKIAYFCLLSLFLMRDQGQILLSYFFGLVWIPTRDNYLFEFLFALLGCIGVSAFTPRLQNIIASVGVAIFAIAPAKNYFYSHPLVEKTPPNYPYFKGDPKINLALNSVKLKTWDRVYFLGESFPKQLPMFGSSLLGGYRQVHAFSSFIPKRYHDWAVFHWFGFTPEDRWSSYEGEYSQETIQKLPFRNTRGIDTNNTYWYMLHAMPPPGLDELKFLGVRHIFSERALPPHSELGPSIPAGSLYSTQLLDPLPRAFTLDKAELDNKAIGEKDFSESLDAKYSHGKIYLGTKSIPLHPVEISALGAEKISLTVDSARPERLVLSELFHPFWQVSVNGKNAKLTPALHLFRSVDLDKGLNQIEFYCEIPFFKWGLGISTLSFLAMLVWLGFLTFAAKGDAHRARWRDFFLTEPDYPIPS